jgi:hypothetical protein
MRRIALVLVVLLAACSSGGSRDEVAPEASGEEGMVNGVLAGLDGVMGDLQRILVRERRITTEVTDRLQAIYTGPELLNQIDAFRADVANGLAGYKATPGNRVTTVSRLVTVSPICMLAEVFRDYSPIAEGVAPAPQSLYVILVTKHEADDPRRLNPTPWAMLYDGVQADGTQPEDVCR